MELAQDSSVRVAPDLVEQVGPSLYQVTIVATVMGEYKLYVMMAKVNEDGSLSSYSALKGSPFDLYWHSHLAHWSKTSVSGSLTDVIYTGHFNHFDLQVRDAFNNPYEAYWHDINLGENQVYHLMLTANGTEKDILFVAEDL